ncbi:MAG: CcmD family protein [Candidatus Kapabacteria bacterium]|nr:CcmD family protein [Candidatus Kapabacteria bacterium]
MIDFLSQNPGYVVLVTILVLWAGLAAYLQRIDARLGKLENTSDR